MTGSRARPGPIPGPVGRLLSIPYSRLIASRNARFDAGFRVIHLDRPVLSIGNLSVGGTGKTPMTIHIVRLLRSMGRSPCIAMRGYGATEHAGSDEAAELAAALPGVPIAVGASRADALIDLFSHDPGVDTVVLDDGFQHRRLARDLDLVLLDATRSPFEDRLLPEGWLREPPSVLTRAHAVVVTHTEAARHEDVDRICESAALINPALTLAVCRHEWVGLMVSDRGVDRAEPVEWLRGKRAGVVCAIGNPGPFVSRAREAIEAAPVFDVRRRDHDPYRVPTINDLLRRCNAAEVLITTAKDWTKLSRARWPIPVVRPLLALRFDQGEQGLADLVKRVVEHGALARSP